VTREELLGEYPVVLACAGSAALFAFTAFFQMGLFAERPVLLPRESELSENFPKSATLSSCLEERLRELRISDGVGSSEEAPPGGAVYAVRPAFKVLGVVVSGRDSRAVVLFEDEKNSRVVRRGQVVAGIAFKEITTAGLSCLWNNKQFYVTME